MKKQNVTFLTQAAMIAAIYVVLTYVFAPFSFGEVQVSLSARYRFASPKLSRSCRPLLRPRSQDCLSAV